MLILYTNFVICPDGLNDEQRQVITLTELSLSHADGVFHVHAVEQNNQYITVVMRGTGALEDQTSSEAFHPLHQPGQNRSVRSPDTQSQAQLQQSLLL